jgi:hypothetical protein
MALKRVKSYSYYLDLDNHKGGIILKDENYQNMFKGLFKDPEEFQVIVGMLRYEERLWFEDEKKQLTTLGPTTEAVGEEQSQK